MRIIFAGTPDFAASSLQALIDTQSDAGHELVAVYTQPDRKAGRGRKLRPSPVKQLALQHDIPVYQPHNFKDAHDRQQLAELKPDLMIVVAYGLILPQRVLDTPGQGCINVHASLLPRWRGAAPIQRAILAGDAESGVCIMQMEAGLDTGPVLREVRTAINANDTGSSLHDRLATLGARALIDTVADIVAGSAVATPQDDSQSNYAAKLDKREAWLDWSRSAIELERQVRAFNPWPVAQTSHEQDHAQRTLRIWEASAQASTGREPPGEVVAMSANGLEIACGEGILNIQRLQLPGGKPLTLRDWLNAGKRDIEVGSQLSGPPE
jgi:methionyl-tRNA formyltransferase